MVAILSIILPFTGILFFSKYFITFLVAIFIPSFSSLVLVLEWFTFASSSIACAKIVAVVVPSPASFTVFLAASFKSVAPMFSTGSNKTIEFATVTPSFVITGLPWSSSSNTHLPLAPRVELTACVSLSIPLNT